MNIVIWSQVHALCLPEESSICTEDSLVNVAQVESEGDEITEQLPPTIKVEDADGDVRETTGVGNEEEEEEVAVEAEQSVHTPAADAEVLSAVEEAAAVQIDDTKTLSDEAKQESEIDPQEGETSNDIPESCHSVPEASTSAGISTKTIPKIAITSDDNGEVDLALDEEVSVALPEVQPQASLGESSGEDASTTLRRYDASFGVPDMVVTAQVPDESQASSEMSLSQEKDVIVADGTDVTAAEYDGAAVERVESIPNEEEEKVESTSPVLGSEPASPVPSTEVTVQNCDDQRSGKLDPEPRAETPSAEHDAEVEKIQEEILVEIEEASDEVGDIEEVVGEETLSEKPEQSHSGIEVDKNEVRDDDSAIDKSDGERREVGPAENQPHENIPDSDIPNATQDRQGRRRSSSCSSAETQVALKIAFTFPPHILRNKVLTCVVRALS